MQDDTLDRRLILLEEMLREQQAELATLREALARKTAAPVVSATLPEPPRPPKPDPSRRQMLKRMGMAVLAGGAALGITAATYAPAEAKFSINPTPKIGAVITRTGASITNIPNTPNFGLIASPDASISLNVGIFGSLIDASHIGVCGLTSANSSSVGVAGYSNTGTGVYGKSDSWYGVRGNSDSGTGVSGFSSSGAAVDGQSYGPDGYGVYGRSFSGTGVAGVAAATTGPAISAKNYHRN